MVIKLLKHRSIHFLSLLGVLLAAALASPSASSASIFDCPDAQDEWYKCLQQFSTFEREMNRWCATAPRVGDPSKHDQCISSLRGRQTIIYQHPGLAGIVACQGPQHAQQFKNCWTQLRQGSDWYRALMRFGRECGFEDVERTCRETEYYNFLQAHGWQPDEAPAGLPSLDSPQDPRITPFILRISAYIRWIVVGLGVLAVFGFIIAGIQYAAAQDNPQAIAGAKGRIVNIVIGVLIYLFMVAALQWLIPGGVF